MKNIIITNITIIIILGRINFPFHAQAHSIKHEQNNLSPSIIINKHKLTFLKITERVTTEFNNANKYFSQDLQKKKKNKEIQAKIFKLLDIILHLVENGDINSIGEETGPLVFTTLTADPPTWGHIELALQGIIYAKANRAYLVSTDSINKAGVSPSDLRFGLLEQIEDLLKPLIKFYGLSGEISTKEEGRRALEIAKVYPQANPIYYVSGDDPRHLDSAPKKLIQYANKHNINLKKIYIIYISRYLSFAKLKKRVKEIEKNYPQLGGIIALKCTIKGISSSSFRKEESPIVPYRIITYLHNWNYKRLETSI